MATATTCKTCGQDVEDSNEHFRCENVHAFVSESDVIEIYYTDDDGEDDLASNVALYGHEAVALSKWLVQAAKGLKAKCP